MNSTKKYLLITVIAFVAFFSILELEPVHNFIEEKFDIKPSITDLFKKSLADDAIEIIASKDKYKSGEEIFFAVQNRTDKTLRLENECPFEPLEVYYLENNSWVHLKAETDIVCENNDDIILEAYELKGSSFLPWSQVIFSNPGKYKLEVEIIGYKNNFQKEFEIVE
ncbi:hypothetical protein ACFL6I_10670 [candidate division KSB1 bacterium]